MLSLSNVSVVWDDRYFSVHILLHRGLTLFLMWEENTGWYTGLGVGYVTIRVVIQVPDLQHLPLFSCPKTGKSTLSVDDRAKHR